MMWWCTGRSVMWKMRFRSRLKCAIASSLLFVFLTPFVLVLIEDTSNKNLPWNHEGEAAVHVRGKIRSVVERTANYHPKVSPVGPTPAAIGCMDLDNLDKDKALVLGHRQQEKGFLTIGITTAERKNVSYLQQTLQSLLRDTSEVELYQLRLVVFACDFEEHGRQEARDIIAANFSEHVQSGLLQLIQAPRPFYPSFSNLKQTFDDPEERVAWRSKENIDSVFLFAYCANLSEYFLQMDDDLEARPGIFRTVREFIEDHEQDHWVILDVGSTGSGKLFRDENVLPMARFMVHFFQENPIDYLFSYFKALHAQEKDFYIKPTIFKHLGKVSSLDLKNKEKKRKAKAKKIEKISRRVTKKPKRERRRWSKFNRSSTAQPFI